MVIILNLFLPGRISGNPGVIETTVNVTSFVGVIRSGVILGYLLRFVVIGSLIRLAIPPAMAARPKFWSRGFMG
ncbi:hypothetical protein ACFLT3_00415 [Chloroflexota bacterium]